MSEEGDVFQRIAQLDQVMANIMESVRLEARSIGTSQDTAAFRSRLKQRMTEGKRQLSVYKRAVESVDSSHPSAMRVSRMHRSRKDEFETLVAETQDAARRHAHTVAQNQAAATEQQRVQEQMAAEDAAAAVQEAIMREETERVRALAQDVESLTDANVRLAQMIGEQSETVGNIESNVTSAKDAVARGRHHLDAAREKQTKSFKKQWILIFLSMIASGALTFLLLTLLPCF